ncbi:MAG TPA: orotidine-5'-phosphate decarboxylase [Dongiaceae bacterium]
MNPPFFIALDMTDPQKAAALAARLKGHIGGVKLGLEFFAANGPAGVRQVTQNGERLFLDLKLHDIPNTVAGAARAVVPLAPYLLTVHAAGGGAMLRAALDAVGDAATKLGKPRPKIIAVTVLTSLSEPDLESTGQRVPMLDQVRCLAALARASGADGAVCSPHEVAALRAECGKEFRLVVPGIRPSWASAGDQKRVMTPGEALRAGASYLVIGRPITGAENPADAARQVEAELR